MKKIGSLLLSLLLLLSMLAGCSLPEEAPAPTAAATQAVPEQAPSSGGTFDLSKIPPFTDQPYVAVNGNIPFFTQEEITDVSFERYSPLDSLGRCGPALASIGQDLMPTEKRGDIGMIKPSGWHTVKYDFVDGKYLYNRCHLIGFQLTAENANKENLITGTRYLNIQGMLPFENMTADYIKETGNHVLYRVTPIFEGDNLVASGVLMEGLSAEDQGEGICFCIYAYNVQPGAAIDYRTGESQEGSAAPEAGPTETPASGTEYILNTSSRKFHLPSCSGAKDMKESNREVYRGSREDLIAQGYEPCKRCNP